MPVLPHYAPIFNIDQLKVYPITVDNSTTLTYGTGVLVNGIKDIQIVPDTVNKELYGDAQILAYMSKVRKLQLTVKYAFLNLDTLATLTGGTEADASTTPTQTSTFDLLSTAFPGYFKIEARVLQTDLGVSTAPSFNMKFFKCKLSDFKPGVGAQEDFALQEFSVVSIPTVKDSKIFDLVYNETAVALS